MLYHFFVYIRSPQELENWPGSA